MKPHFSCSPCWSPVTPAQPQCRIGRSSAAPIPPGWADGRQAGPIEFGRAPICCGRRGARRFPRRASGATHLPHGSGRREARHARDRSPGRKDSLAQGIAADKPREITRRTIRRGPPATDGKSVPCITRVGIDHLRLRRARALRSRCPGCSHATAAALRPRCSMDASCSTATLRKASRPRRLRADTRQGTLAHLARAVHERLHHADPLAARRPR